MKVEEIRAHTKAKDIGYIAKKQKVGYAGYTMRMKDERRSEWTLYGCKRKGDKPKNRYRDIFWNMFFR